jgi:hypothetical protein
VFQTPLGFSNVSAFSARSAVKLGGIVISLEKSIVPSLPPLCQSPRIYSLLSLKFCRGNTISYHLNITHFKELSVNSLPILIKIIDTDFTNLHIRYCPDYLAFTG